MTNAGVNNPNYKDGHTIDPRCACGRSKDHRSKRCATCANRGVPVGGEDRWTIEDIKTVLLKSSSILEAAKSLGISRQTVARVVWAEMIDLSHMPAGKGRPTTPDKIFCIKKERDARTRKYLRQWDPDNYVCAVCRLGPEWAGAPLTLQMDHINGNACDDRKENLRWLCPNCHTQTPTFTGRNMKKGGPRGKILDF